MLHGSVAEWSKALVLGTSLFGGVGSNPTTAKPILDGYIPPEEGKLTWLDLGKAVCQDGRVV